MNPTLDFPRVAVEFDGRPLAGEDAGTLEEVRVHQELSLPAQCELFFVGPTTGGMAGTVAGLPLRVHVEGQPEPLFAGDITAVEYIYSPSGGLQVRVRAYDVLNRLRNRQPVRAHVQITALDLARELVKDLGISVEGSDPGPTLQRLIQHQQSDLQLLADVTRRCGLFFTLRGNQLQLLSLEGVGESVPLRLGESLLEARLELNETAICNGVSASAWDPWRVECHEGRASAPRPSRKANLEVSGAPVNGHGTRTLTSEIAQNEAQAASLAQADLDIRAARQFVLWGVAEGDVRLAPGTRVAIQGVAPPAAGEYVLTSVTHTVDRAKGFVSEVSSTPPKPQARTRAANMALAVVTRVDDPEHRGRVRVVLPAHGNVETEWMGVLATAAGKKGLVALPDAGDHVLVLFQGEDPGQGLVIGGLYGADVPADWGIDGGAVRRYTFMTPAGQKLRLDDTRKLVRIENSDGSYVELSPEKVRLHSQADLEIEAPGRALVLRGKTVDFQKA